MIGSFGGVPESRAAVVAAMLALIGVACSPGTDARDSARVVATTPDAISISRQRSEDLTGDGAPEMLTLAARGPAIDSLRVRLEIRSASDSLLYAATWDSHFYFQYVERASLSDAAADSIVRRHLDVVLGDTAFRVVPAATGRDTIQTTMMRDAIRYDIATHRLRTAHGIAPGEEVPPSAHDSINVLATAVRRAEIDALVDELRGRRSFTFFAGGEVTYSIAWSDREKRFVTVFSCC